MLKKVTTTKVLYSLCNIRRFPKITSYSYRNIKPIILHNMNKFSWGYKLFCGNFMGSTCRAYDHIVPREEGGAGGFTNAFSSNLNIANPKIFPKSWQDIALTNRIMEELIFELNS